MRRILILTGRYLPGYRDGGPVRSIKNLTDWMGDRYDIRIMCLDRDHGDAAPYPGIRTGEYTIVGKAKVFYTARFTEKAISALSKDADVIYCCGPYSDYARMVMRLHRKNMIKAPLFIASMGSFSPGAFGIKSLKKRLFVKFMKLSGMFDGITWSVTSKREEEELKAVIGQLSACVRAQALPAGSFRLRSRYREASGIGRLDGFFIESARKNS